MFAQVTLVLLGSLVTGVFSQGIGAFTAFTDSDCSEGGQEISVPENGWMENLPDDTRSVKGSLDEKCALLVWDDDGGAPIYIIRQEEECYDIPESATTWSVLCPEE